MTRVRLFSLLTGACLAAGLVSWQPGAAAEESAATAETCQNRTDVLGVSRIVEIDTTGGPRFGQPGPEPFELLADKEVVLTFDDGPMRRFTRPILDDLDAQCTKATFYVVGRMALSDPETLRETARRGHTIGSHTWSHKRLDQIGAAKAKDEIELAVSAIALALGEPIAPFFRFPYLGESSAMRAHLKSRNISNVAIDVDSRDFLTRNGATMRQNVMKQLAKRGKGIILFHDIQPSTARGLKDLLAELKAGGYKVVHMVPKAPALTLPEYDQKAMREAQRRKIALSSQPLSDRSVTWPVSPGTSQAAGEELPWADPAPRATPRPAPPTPAPAAPLKPTIKDDSWATHPLGRF